MIGYYIHHVGRGHLHRSQALASELGTRGHSVTGLSSLARPAGWAGEWVELPRDDDGPTTEVTAHGRLHWAPREHPGLRARMATVSSWIEERRPDLVVVDVSVEMLLLARLHGVPTLAVLLPGRRGDSPHTLGHDVADTLVSFWPENVPGMTEGLSTEALERLVPVGGMSRHPVRGGPAPVPREAGRRVVVLLGAGGHDVSPRDIEAARTATPDWRWTVLDGSPATWVEDPATTIADADVIITHAGQNAVAETAAARRPAIVIPQSRPHDEQLVTASVLSAGWPVVVRSSWPQDGWPALLQQAVELDGARWSGWCDGRAGQRFADLVERSTGTAAQRLRA